MPSYNPLPHLDLGFGLVADFIAFDRGVEIPLIPTAPPGSIITATDLLRRIIRRFFPLAAEADAALKMDADGMTPELAASPSPTAQAASNPPHRLSALPQRPQRYVSRYRGHT